ncbi:MAG TPA: phosphoribosyl-ATP diphosphatase [Candidatus Acidoferrales bacterium]|nr:phosphoribosyl-ATP diphosphatase [Candidatus Acidoferrales bacterium]
MIGAGERLLESVDFEKAGGTVPTIVCDAVDGRPRMLAYSTRESLSEALRSARGVYWSRSRNSLWRKGETSGNVQHLVAVVPDCDRDALVFYVEQFGSTCHLGEDTCFAGHRPFTWSTLIGRVAARARDERNATSYTRALLSDDELLAAKLSEEAGELADATSPDEVAWECADLLYFMTVKMRRTGIGIADVMAVLERRAT